MKHGRAVGTWSEATRIPVCKRRLRTCACDIYAEPNVAWQSQLAETICSPEVDAAVLRLYAPKLRLGETHVPLSFLARRAKTLPIVVKIGYARY
jgi:hypothetical protein